jgi:hypothetical protein
MELTPPSSSSPLIPSSPASPPQPYLTKMRPLFPPAPFTPSHPAFLHFSTLAITKSQQLRSSAEEDLSKLIAEKSAAVQIAEENLRRQVEIIWKRFREGINQVEQDRASSLRSSPRKSANGNDKVVAQPAVAIRDFVPVPTLSPTRLSMPMSPPRMSSLSASLVQSSFHHPNAVKGSPPYNEGSHPLHDSHNISDSSANQTFSSPSRRSSGSISIRSNSDGGSKPEAFKRSMDPNKDTVASFRYFTILEANSARTVPERDATEEGTQTVSRGRSGVVKMPANGDKLHSMINSQDGHDAHASAGQRTGGEDGERFENRNSSKGKRKVTFEVRPEVVDAENVDVAVPESEEGGESSRTF